jgi:A/G-specific adenine glycosylase
MTSLLNEFTRPLLEWHKGYGRKHLPWKEAGSPYHIWLSEIMLQQTQVKTVIPYFLRFIESFPTLAALAAAPEDDVLALWSGLGYYSRARYLHQTAQIIQQRFNGEFPEELETLKALPGIGPSTAAAICAQAFHQPTPILDGNVKRVLSRYFLIEGTASKTTQVLWELAAQCMSHEQPADYTQAIMDLGATCCTNKNPQCTNCPVTTTCLATLHNLTEAYPQKKLRKPLPTQHQQFLILQNQAQEIYLEKRPSQGIWASLWSLPSVDMHIDPTRYIQETYPLEVLEITPLTTIKHTFTHFHLWMNTLGVKTRDRLDASTTPHSQGRWYSFPETIKLGLAKPIRDIVERFFHIKEAS